MVKRYEPDLEMRSSGIFIATVAEDNCFGGYVLYSDYTTLEQSRLDAVKTAEMAKRTANELQAENDRLREDLKLANQYVECASAFLQLHKCCKCGHLYVKDYCCVHCGDDEPYQYADRLEKGE